MNRTPLETIAFAAWVNCPPDRIPAEYRQHTCEATMIAWRRVVAAIVAESQKHWQKNARETWEAMCAMRDSINEHVPMPSAEADLLEGPEASVFCATVAEAVVRKIQELKAPMRNDVARDGKIRTFKKEFATLAEAKDFVSKLDAAKILAEWV